MPTDELATYVPLEPTGTLTEALARTISRRPDSVAVRSHDNRLSYTWRELGERVEALAKGFHSLGLRRGDKIAMLMANRPEFFAIDLALVRLGVVPFSLYATSSREQNSYALEDSGARAIIVSAPFLPRLEGVELPELRVMLDEPTADGWLAVDDLVARGAEVDLSSVRDPEPDDLLTMIYTSGTTGAPKGALISHRNLMYAADSTLRAVKAPTGTTIVSWLPTAHIGERTGGYGMTVVQGFEAVTVADPREVVNVLPEINPGYFYGPPRTFEKLRASFESWVLTLDEAERDAVTKGLEASFQQVRCEQAGDAVPDEVRALSARARDELIQPWRAQVGLDNLQIAVVATAPNPGPLMEFYHAIGIPMAEVYGLTESGAGGTSARMGEIRIGTVGRPGVHVELKIADDGEILLRGPSIFVGYHNRPDATAEAVDDEGWLHTGDLGSLDDAGYLKVIGRKKEILVTSSGKNVSPVTVESAIISSSPLIGQTLAFGEGRPYLVALIVLDGEYARSWAAQEGLAATDLRTLAEDPRLLAAVGEAVARGNEKLNRVEQIKKFHVLPHEWLPGTVELTPTSKMRREPIIAKYADIIEGLYS
ncbi:AMP-dependent synthetase/ligase [Microbacterium sp. NPDC055442]